jgi:hypothetical protein
MMARRGDTKPLCHGAQAGVALPGVGLLPLRMTNPFFGAMDFAPKVRSEI